MEPLPYLESSPHVHAPQQTAQIMRAVIYSLLPACAASVYFFGVAALWVLLLATLGCLAVEAACQRLMGKPVTVSDGSAVVTGILLALNLPPTSPWWLTLLGAVIAIASILLVLRHPQVSPWFPMLLLIYPVWETIFSIYRKAARGQSPGLADALHFHQLVYRRIVRQVFDDDEARRMLMRNNRTSPYLWGFAVLTVLPAVLFWNQTPLLMLFIVIFIVSYVWAYTSIIRFKVPRWLRR